MADRSRIRLVGARREKRVVVVCSDEEHARLTRMAASAGVSIPRLMMESTMGTPSGVRRAAIIELSGIRRQLAGLGSNINQMTAHANQDAKVGRPHEADWPRWAAALAVLDHIDTEAVETMAAVRA